LEKFYAEIGAEKIADQPAELWEKTRFFCEKELQKKFDKKKFLAEKSFFKFEKNKNFKKICEKIFAEKICGRKIFIIGRGAMHPMALEAAIKIQEVSYISAHGFAAGELKHGPLALIEKNVPCVVLGAEPEIISNATELKSRGAKILGIAAKKNPIFDFWIRVPDCGGADAIATIIPVQILAYFLARLKNLDPDFPRNLAKSVTVK